MKTVAQELRELMDGPAVGAVPDPLDPLRGQLATLDASAYDARGPINVLVKNAVALAVTAEGVEGPGAGLVKVKDVAGRLMTAFSELVSMLSASQGSVGYTPAGPSVVTEPAETPDPEG